MYNTEYHAGIDIKFKMNAWTQDHFHTYTGPLFLIYVHFKVLFPKIPRHFTYFSKDLYQDLLGVYLCHRLTAELIGIIKWVLI